MSGCGLHRKGKRKERKNHWRRPPFLDRLKQSRQDRGLEPTYSTRFDPKDGVDAVGHLVNVPPSDKNMRTEPPKPEKRPGILRRIFNRKVGS